VEENPLQHHRIPHLPVHRVAKLTSPATPAHIKEERVHHHVHASPAKAIELVSRMMHDFHLTKMQAVAAVGWMAYESGNFKVLQEGGHAGVNSGYGWAQWTGNRRINYFGYAKTEKLDRRSDAATTAF